MEHEIRLAVQQLAMPNPGGGTAEVVTVSIGIAALDRDNPIGAIGRADRAMYAAKQGGRDRVVEWTPALAVGQPAEAGGTT